MPHATSYPAVRITDAAAADLPAILALNASNVPHVGPIDAPKLERLHGEAFALRVARVVGDDRDMRDVRDGRDDGNDYDGDDHDGGAGGPIVAFFLAMVETAEYESLNFRWFVERYPRFTYVDRIAVAEGYRGLGIGRRLYADVEALARGRGRGTGDGAIAEWLTCEVNIAPPNPGSMAFHERLGFVGVGERWDAGGGTGVRMLAKAVR
ncbi:MAG: GNAT family N-acetyltransferase [Ardenticatenales bacterium]|nr:GNAT family N-acetyltransferase [Ardenticatenales bacterium]